MAHILGGASGTMSHGQTPIALYIRRAARAPRVCKYVPWGSGMRMVSMLSRAPSTSTMGDCAFGGRVEGIAPEARRGRGSARDYSIQLNGTKLISYTVMVAIR